jgi:hypothetical protein
VICKPASAFALLVCAICVPALPLAAASCTSGTLASYIALGNTGCTIGNDTFFDFQLIADQSGGGAPAINASDITVIGLGPSGTSGAGAVAPILTDDIGVEFEAIWATTAGQIQEDEISFAVSVSPSASEITDAGLIQDSNTTGNGSVTVAEKGCSGLTFPCSQLWGVATNDTQAVEDTIFSATGTLSVEKDIAVSGNSGTAGLSSVADVFSVSNVPEPRALVLLLALALACGLIFRFLRNRTIA